MFGPKVMGATGLSAGFSAANAVRWTAPSGALDPSAAHPNDRSDDPLTGLGMFKTELASAWLIEAIEKGGAPRRKIFDWDKAKIGAGAFRLCLAPPEHVKATRPPPPSKSSLVKAPASRAEKYFQAMVIAERKRGEVDEAAEQEEERRLLLQASAQADAQQQTLWKLLQDVSSNASTSEDPGDEGEEGVADLDDEQLEKYLRPYAGSMRVEIEVAVQRAPGAEPDGKDRGSYDSDEQDSEHDGQCWGSSDSEHDKEVQQHKDFEEEGKEENGLSMEEEMRLLMSEVTGWEEKNASQAAAQAAAQAEEDEIEAAGQQGGADAARRKMKEKELAKKAEAETAAAAAAAAKRMPIDHPKPQSSLLLGGTACLLPDAERLALAPSLPPPPPFSLLGRHKMKMKPRLPLSISFDRYRDEGPCIPILEGPCLDDAKRQSLASGFRTVELYAATASAVSQHERRRLSSTEQRPAPVRPRMGYDPDKLDDRGDALDKLLCKELNSGIAWKAVYDGKLEEQKAEAAKAKNAKRDAKWGSFGGVDPFK